MPKLISKSLNIIADIIYPKYCFGCKRIGSYLCKFCMQQISKLATRSCIVCHKVNISGLTCPKCKTNFTPDRLLCAFPYQNKVISDMIITGKYYFIPEVFVILGAMIAEALFNLTDHNEISDFVVCALPLHSSRLKWRGFNQAEVAARIFAQGLSLPYSNLLIRNKKTKTQKDLKALERKDNMLNAFTCPKVVPSKIIIIDDVTTTGQTFLEATKALKSAGAKQVWCVSIAKD
jgi:competence protein ComFC